MVRDSVRELQSLGTLPVERQAVMERIDAYQVQIESVAAAVSDAEARILLDLFNAEDDCFGLGWSLIHLIETAPGWPTIADLRSRSGYCIEIMKQRCVHSGYEI